MRIFCEMELIRSGFGGGKLARLAQLGRSGMDPMVFRGGARSQCSPFGSARPFVAFERSTGPFNSPLANRPLTLRSRSGYAMG